MTANPGILDDAIIFGDQRCPRRSRSSVQVAALLTERRRDLPLVSACSLGGLPRCGARTFSFVA